MLSGILPCRVYWWPVIAMPVAIGLVILASLAVSLEEYQVFLEDIAPFLIGPAALLYLVRAGVTRNPLYVILAFLGAALTYREIHEWDGQTLPFADQGIYVALVLSAAWTILWTRRLREPLKDRNHTSWLLAALACYFIAVLIDRRVFKFVPGERGIHTALEETAETVAHLVFMGAAVVGSWRRYGRGRGATEADSRKEEEAAIIG